MAELAVNIEQPSLYVKRSTDIHCCRFDQSTCNCKDPGDLATQPSARRHQNCAVGCDWYWPVARARQFLSHRGFNNCSKYLNDTRLQL